MSALDTFDEQTRAIVIKEIARHRQAAYQQGLEQGRQEAGPQAFAAWLKGCIRSNTMQAGALALAVGLAAQFEPEIKTVLVAYLGPDKAAILGGIIMMILRLKTDKPIAQR